MNPVDVKPLRVRTIRDHGTVFDYIVDPRIRPRWRGDWEGRIVASVREIVGAYNATFPMGRDDSD